MDNDQIGFIPRFARAAVTMTKFAGTEITMDVQGLSALDTVIADFRRSGGVKGPNTISAYGCLTGEIIRTSYGGEWKRGPDVGYYLEGVGDVGLTVFPFAQVMRCSQDPEHSLAALSRRIADRIESGVGGVIDEGDQQSLANFMLDAESAGRSEPPPGQRPTIEPDAGVPVQRRITVEHPSGRSLTGAVHIETACGGRFGTDPDSPSHFVVRFESDEGEPAGRSTGDITVYDLLFRDGERVADVSGDLERSDGATTGAVSNLLDGRDLITYVTETEQRQVHVKYMDTRMRLAVNEHEVVVRCCHHQARGYGGYRTIEYTRPWSEVLFRASGREEE